MKHIKDWVMENGTMPSTRQLMILMGYKSPRSTMLLMEELANGNIVVALIDDEAPVKEFYRRGDIVILLPRSTNGKHQPIICTYDLKIQGLVEAVIPKIN